MNNKILFLCVNYNSYRELDNFIESIIISAKNHNEEVQIDVMIADNTVDNNKIMNFPCYSCINIDFRPYHENLGYMGAIMRLIKDKGFDKVKDYDYVVFSNVDLILDKTFIKQLLSVPKNKNIGWIAPKILSKSEKKDRNPKILKRPSKAHLNKILIMFRYPILYILYHNFIYRFRRKQQKYIFKSEIYAGHGSLMIFSKAFIVNNIDFRYPSFLFGEELFFAELNRLSNLKVIYLPKIKVFDIDHISTGNLKKKFYCKLNKESIEKIIKLFWNE